MSQVNIQQLLSLNPVQPVQTSATPVDYKTSTFQGGEYRPGQMAQLPRSSEELMYSTLSQIAGSTGQAFQTFGNIASQLDKERINNAETEWDKIDAEDINPDEKIVKWNKYVAGIETPIIGEDWKTRLSAKVSKNWGKDAYEKFVKDRYDRRLVEWGGYDGIMGPHKTDEFLFLFGTENPALTGSDFYLSKSLQTRGLLQREEDLSTANSIVLAQSVKYSISDDMVKGLAERSLDINELRKTSPELVRALELASSSLSKDAFAEAFSKEFFEPISTQLDQLPLDVQAELANKQLNPLKDSTILKIWEASRRIGIENAKFNLRAGVQTSLAAFKASPSNTSQQQLATQARVYLPNLAAAEQVPYLGQIVNELYLGLASNKWGGFESFTGQPITSQLSILKDKIKETLPETDTLKLLKPGLFGNEELNYDTLVTNLLNSFMASENGLKLNGSAMSSVNTVIKGLDAQVKIAAGYGRNIPINQIFGNVITEMAKSTGLDESVLRDIIIKPSLDANGKPILTPDGKPQYELRGDLSSTLISDPRIKAELAKIGWGKAQLDELFSNLSTLVPTKNKGTGGETGGTKTPTLSPDKYPTPEKAIVTLNQHPELGPQAFELFNSGQVLNDQTGEDVRRIAQEHLRREVSFNQLVLVDINSAIYDSLSPVEQQMFKSGQEAVEKRNRGGADTETLEMARKFDIEYGPGSTRFNEMAIRQFGTSKLDEIHLYDPTKPTVASYTENRENWVDKNGNLTGNGRLLGLRLRFEAQEWARVPNEEGHSQYIKSLKEQIDVLAKGDLRSADPALLYRTLYALKGLKDGKYEPIGLTAGMGESDAIYFHHLLEFISVSSIPENLTFMNERTRIFMNAFNVGITTLAMPQNASNVDIGLKGKTDSTREMVLTLATEVAKGRFKSINLDNANSDGTNTTIRIGQLLRIPGIDSALPVETNANRVLENIWKIVQGIVPVGTNGRNALGLPSPSDTLNGGFVDIPGETEPIAWNKATADQKLAFYFNQMMKQQNDQVLSLLVYPLVAGQIMTTSEIFGSEQDRQDGVATLIGATSEYYKRRSQIPSIVYPSILFKGTSGSWSPLGNWNLRYIYDRNLPQVNTSDVGLQPQNLIDGVLSASFKDGRLQDLSEMEDILDDIDPDNGEYLAEDVGNLIHAERIRSGIGKGLDPADQFVVGLCAMPAEHETIQYFLRSLGISDKTTHQLKSTLNEDQLKEFEFIIGNRSDTTVLEVLDRFFPDLYLWTQQRLLDFNLGRENKDKVRFDISLDKTHPTLTYHKDKFFRTVQIDESVPKLEKPVDYSLEPAVPMKRWLRTLLFIKKLQNKGYVSSATSE